MNETPEERDWMAPDADERLAELVAEALRHLNMDDDRSGPWNIFGITSDRNN